MRKGEEMTQTNTYESLCDDVGAYEATYTYDIEGINWFGGIFTQTFTKKQFKEDAWRWTTKEYRSDRKVVKVNKKNDIPPASAEQRERLEELILNLGRLSYHKSDVYYICILTRINNANNGMAGTRPDALYALTHKLYKEGVLSKEEVKEALIG